MKSGGGERQVRSDKKVDVKATMSTTLKSQLYDFAFLCKEPVKDVANKLCIKGAVSDPVIRDIAKWFRRNYKYKRAIVYGRSERPRLQLTPQGDTGRVSMRMTNEEYDTLRNLAIALDITTSATATVLIRKTTLNNEFMNEYVKYLDVDERTRGEIRQFCTKFWKINFIRED